MTIHIANAEPTAEPAAVAGVDSAVLVLSQDRQPGCAVEVLISGPPGTSYLLRDREDALAEPTERGRPRADPLETLSTRERDVLAAMADGLTNRGIAERLFIAEHTVEKHVSSIFNSLRLPSSDIDHRRVLAVVAYLRAF